MRMENCRMAENKELKGIDLSTVPYPISLSHDKKLNKRLVHYVSSVATSSTFSVLSLRLLSLLALPVATYIINCFMKSASISQHDETAVITVI